MKTRFCSLLPIPLLALPLLAQASVSATRVELGYKAHSGATLARNPGAFDQPFLQLDFSLAEDWGRLFSTSKLENPGRWARDQSGQPGRMTFKSLNVLEPKLGDSDYHLLLQNFISASSSSVEDNVYLGATRDLSWGPASLSVGAGWHYTASSFRATDLAYTGPSGYFALVNLRYPFSLLGHSNAFSIAYNGQFDRAGAHQAVFRYQDYGHQLVNTLKTELTDRLYTKLYLTHLDSIGATPFGNLEYGFAIGLNL